MDVADLDGTGRLAILTGEHDAFAPVDAAIHAELSIHRPEDRAATRWSEEVVDTRFEHFDGAKAIRLPSGRMGIVSHGWLREPRPLVLWSPAEGDLGHPIASEIGDAAVPQPEVRATLSALEDVAGVRCPTCRAIDWMADGYVIRELQDGSLERQRAWGSTDPGGAWACTQCAFEVEDWTVLHRELERIRLAHED